MKLGNLKFGINAVVAGQKSATLNAIPQLIANSTAGKFVITAPVSKALGIAVGENVMFLNNISAVEAAIQNQPEELVQWCIDNGIDINTPEGADTVVKAFTQWYIAKGEKLYDAKGNPVMASIRYTKEDKEKFIAEHGMELVAANREDLLARLGVEEASDEELLASISVDDVESPKFHAMSGSKTATTSSATGVGLQLNFTDSAIWGALKSDLGDDKDKKNRYFNVALDESEEVPFNNGQKEVIVRAYPISFDKDTDPVQRVAKA